MKFFLRLLGVLFILVPLAFMLFLHPRCRKASGDQSVASSLAAELRLALKSPVFAVLNDLEPYRKNQSNGMIIFEVLKQMQASGRLYGGYVEVSTLELMDPLEAETQAEAAKAFGPMAVSMPPGIKLPTPEYLDDFIAQVQKIANDGRVPQDTFYMQNPQDASLGWVLRPYQTPDDSTVKLIGLAFSVQQLLTPQAIHAIENQFSPTPSWQKQIQHYALELQNSAGQSAATLGDKTGKSLVQETRLDHTDLGHIGWTIQVWGKPASALLPWLVAAGVMLVGVILLLIKPRQG